MKKIILLFVVLASFVAAQAQFNPNVAIKWNPLGLLVGDVSLQGEYSFGKKHSLTAKIGIPVDAQQDFTYDGKDASFNMKATSFLAGYRSYFGKKRMRGIYLEPFFQYVHHTSDGTGSGTLGTDPVVFNFTNDYNGTGVGLQLGTQFMIGQRIVVDLFFLGPQISSAENNFKAIEVTHTIPWNTVQASEAEQDIRNFIDQFPFIKNHTTVVVDQNNRTVTANFNGAAPGIRTGISIGIAL